MSLANSHNAKANTHRTEPQGCRPLAATLAVGSNHVAGVSSEEETRKNREMKEEPTISLIIKDRVGNPRCFANKGLSEAMPLSY
jgi:hypothetical protein